MAIPLIYNVRSVRVRWVSTAVAVFGIAGVVSVFVAMLAMAQGFESALVASGSPYNVIIRRGGATSEMDSALTRQQIRIAADAPDVLRGRGRVPLVSPEVVVLVSLPMRRARVDAMVQVRGVSQLALDVRNVVKVSRGRLFRPGMAEIVVGSNVATSYRDCQLGGRPVFGGRQWHVVGVLDAQGSAFDSEIWADAVLLQQTYKRQPDIFQSATIRLTSPEAYYDFVNSLSGDPRLTLQIDRERDYYERQSQAVSTIIRVLGIIVAIVMGIGAVFGALNTMYASVAARAREIATVRAIGFAEWSIVTSFLIESLFISCIGGLVGCLAVIPINGYSTSTINWQTFSNLAFAFTITPTLLGQGMLFALAMGLIGGLPPAIRAARMPIITALREL